MTESEPKRKLLACITELDIGGAEKAFVRILIGLKERGWQVHVVSLRDAGPMATKLGVAGIPVDALQCGGLADLRAIGRLKAVVNSFGPDVILSFLHQANLYARLAARGSDAAVVSGIRVADRRRAIVWTDRMTSSLVDQYVGVGATVMKKHAQWCRLAPEKCMSIPNGVDLPHEVNGIDQRAKNVVLFVGRLTEQKSPETLLHVIAGLRDRRFHVCLRMVGDGPLREHLQAIVQRLNLHDFVEFVGHSDNVAEEMNNATILALPSRWEGMPNVVLEAMAHGLPVVATAVDGTADIIENGKDGILVPMDRPGEFQSAVEELLSNQQLRTNLADAARQKVRSEYSWDHVVQSYDELLRVIVGG